jgi:hypothetical protein
MKSPYDFLETLSGTTLKNFTRESEEKKNFRNNT